MNLHNNTPSARTGEGLNVPHVSRFTESFRKRHLDYLWDIEHRFTFEPGYPLSRLLPTVGDMEEFYSFMGIENLRSLTFLQRIQTFLIWRTDNEKFLVKNSADYNPIWAQKLSPVYYMGLNGGLPPLFDEKTIICSGKPEQKSIDFQRYTAR